MYSKVVSSGATIPARAPPSIDILHIVMRPSMESPRTGLACILKDVAVAARNSDLSDHREDHVPSR